jgi:hypothetical protein
MQVFHIAPKEFLESVIELQTDEFCTAWSLNDRSNVLKRFLPTPPSLRS